VNTTRALPGLKEFPSLRRSYLRDRHQRAALALEALPREDAPAEPQYVRNPARELAALEDKTETFRRAMAWRHCGKLLEINQRARLALEEWTDVANGESPPAPCVNVAWRKGAKKPAKLAQRCTMVTDDHGPRRRCAKLAGHEGEHRISLVRRPCQCCVCVLHDATTAREWHEGRKEGQRFRFDRVRACGTRFLVAGCGVCGTDRHGIPEGCGVRRVCKRCDVAGAIGRRARFGRARGRAFVHGHRYGLSRRNRRGGRYSEKMLTLTIPHALRADATGIVKEAADGFFMNDVAARVIAAFEAWPRFLKKLNRHWRSLGSAASHVVYHRAFEWTPGRSDNHGHPHFHVYLWSPFVDRLLIRAWWAEALREVGWPVAEDEDGNPKLSTRIQMLRSNGVSEVRELIKGGQRGALTLSRLAFVDGAEGVNLRRGFRKGEPVGPGVDAFKYAEGWTLGDVEDCSDDVRAQLYKVLEARRLTQASRGFFLEEDPVSCACCGAQGMFRVRFDVAPIANDVPFTPVHPKPSARSRFPWETGPP